MEKITAVVLAAGKGTRMGESPMGSEIPKVMYEIAGVPMIRHTIENLKEAGISNIYVVDGYKREVLEDYLGNSVSYAFQEDQLGTGHALMTTKEKIEGNSDAVLVCNGDMPLFKSGTIKQMLGKYFAEKPTIAMLSVNFEDPAYWAYGRIKRDDNNEILGIVEQKDCDEKELLISECNAGFYIFDGKWLWENIHLLKTLNVQKEYYLTDMIKIAKEQDKKIIAIPVSTESEALGINTPEQLELAENVILGEDEILAKV